MTCTVPIPGPTMVLLWDQNMLQDQNNEAQLESSQTKNATPAKGTKCTWATNSFVKTHTVITLISCKPTSSTSINIKKNIGKHQKNLPLTNIRGFFWTPDTQHHHPWHPMSIAWSESGDKTSTSRKVLRFTTSTSPSKKLRRMLGLSAWTQKGQVGHKQKRRLNDVPTVNKVKNNETTMKQDV